MHRSRQKTADVCIRGIVFSRSCSTSIGTIPSAVVPLVSRQIIGRVLGTHAWRACSYTGDDPICVELAGALKNVYAIAAGIAAGLGFENNARASE